MLPVSRVLFRQSPGCGVLFVRVTGVRFSSRPSPRPRAPEQKATNNNKSYSQQSLERLQAAKKATGASAHESLENNSRFNDNASKGLNDLRKEFIKRAEADPAMQAKRKVVGRPSDPKSDDAKQ